MFITDKDIHSIKHCSLSALNESTDTKTAETSSTQSTLDAVRKKLQ